MEGRSDRLLFRLNTIDEDFAEATKAALADLSDYKVSLSCHPVPKSRNPNWTLALGDRTLCERLIEDTNRKSIIPAYVFEWSHEMRLAFIGGLMDSEGFVAVARSAPRRDGEPRHAVPSRHRGVGLRTGEVRDRRVQAGSLAIPTCECRARSKLLRTLSGVVQEPSVRARLLSH